MNAIDVHHIIKQFTMNPAYASRISLRNLAYQAINPFKTLKKTTTQFTALDDISFSLKKGETLGIIGANGSGKSTLLRIIAGITSPTQGTVTTYGSITSLFTLGLGFHPDLSGRENIFLNAAILGYNRKKVEKELPAIIKFSELEKFMDVPVKHYSSGMYARLGFAIATAKGFEPDILLLDETLTVGDITFKKRAYARLKELVKLKKTAVLFVHHDLKILEELCSRCLWLEKGRIIEFGKTKKVIDVYTKHFNKSLIS